MYQHPSYRLVITWERAREDESAYFSQTAPWSMLNGESKQRLGTGNLSRHLSKKLCDLIAERSVFSSLLSKENPVPNCPVGTLPSNKS
jgi:hypothetical protein